MMPTLDVVLQTPPPRPIATNRGKGELEKDSQPGSGFDDVLAQSGSKDDQPVSEPAEDTKTSKLVQIKNPRGYDLPKGEAQSQLAVAAQSRSLPEESPVDAKAIDYPAAPTSLPQLKDKLGLNAKLENAEMLKPMAADVPVAEVAKPVVKIETLLAKALESASVDGSQQKVMAEATAKPDKSEKTEKTGKQNSDKKAVALKEDNQSPDDSNGVKSLLDILASPNTNAAASAEALPPAQVVSQQTMPEETMASMLQVVSPPVVSAKDKRADETHGKNPTKSSMLPDQPNAGDADKIFRFSRADGTDKAVELRLSSKDKATDQSDVASAPQGKTENIVVLESRRYLALAPESNAFNLVSQIAGDKELSSALTSSIIDPAKSAATSKVVNTLKLQMTPHDLGTVTATLRLRGEELSVAITVQNSAAYNHLTSDQDKMVEALRAQGFAVDQVTVQLVSADRSASQDQQPQSSSQGQQQQEARNGASAQQGRQQGNGASQDNPANRNWQNFDTGGNPANTVATGPAERRDGQVYV